MNVMKVLFSVLLFLGAIVVFISSCQTKNLAYETVSVEKFRTLLLDENIQVLDVRNQSEYDEGHIEKAILIPITNNKFEDLVKNKLDKSRPVAIYCRSGRRSEKASTLLGKMGYKVYNLKGGYDDIK